MSSAPARIPPVLGRALRGLLWTALFVVLAASGAGIVSGAWHPPGSAGRAELTYARDAALGARLDAAMPALIEVAGEVEVLAREAKSALAEVTSTDQTRLRDSLQRGDEAAATIVSRTAELRTQLAGLPGDGPDAAVSYSNGLLVRRAAMLGAIDAASGLAVHWRAVAARAGETANLTGTIDRHDQTVVAAAAEGVAGDWPAAIAILDQALLMVADVQTLRARLVAGSDGTVLDEWIERNRDHDVALRAVYRALRDSGGVRNNQVEAALLEEQRALARLPQDRRAIIIIVSEVTRGSLTDAVVAIDAANGLIDEALADAGAPLPATTPGTAPGTTGTAPAPSLAP